MRDSYKSEKILEVFGGRDHLRLMFNAKRFRMYDGKNCYTASFWVGELIVYIRQTLYGEVYQMRIMHRKEKVILSNLWITGDRQLKDSICRELNLSLDFC